MLKIENLTFRISGRTLIENADLFIADGHHIGLIGRNGTGKTTLFKLLVGEHHPDDGEISYPKGMRIGLVDQHPPGGDQTPLEAVLAADTERADLEAELLDCDDGMRIGDIYVRLSELEAHKAPSRAALILKGLGFSEEDQGRPLSSFSGGWRMRVALASVLFSQPDLLLLDEPTNHLDLEACVWLEDYLVHYPRTIVFISHERSFLNRVANSIVELTGKKLKLYKGNYDQFVENKSLQEEHAQFARDKAEAQIKHMQVFVDKFKAKATKAKQAQSRMKAIEKIKEGMEDVAEGDGKHIKFIFPSTDLMPPPILTCHKGLLYYDEDKPVIQGLGFSMQPDIRLGLLGANGNGKTTLAKYIAGILPLREGYEHRSSQLKIAYFEQYQIENLRMEESAFDHLTAIWHGKMPEEVRNRLGQFGFGGDRAFQKVKVLSGGEKTRLNFALLTIEAPHLLILDEPTNHLDLDSKEALAESLQKYKGGVIIISHDFDFLSKTVDNFWLISNKTVTPWDKDLKAYRKFILESVRGASKKSEDKKAKKEKSKKPKDALKQKEQLEKKIQRLIERRESIVAELGEGSVYVDDPDKANRLVAQEEELGVEIAKLEDEWVNLSG